MPDRYRRVRETASERDGSTPEHCAEYVLDSLLKLFLWWNSDEAKQDFEEKEEDVVSATASIITNLLQFVAADGHSPLQVLENAIFSYSNQLSQDGEFRLVGEFLEEMLDVAADANETVKAHLESVD